MERERTMNFMMLGEVIILLIISWRIANWLDSPPKFKNKSEFIEGYANGVSPHQYSLTEVLELVRNRIGYK